MQAGLTLDHRAQLLLLWAAVFLVLLIGCLMAMLLTPMLPGLIASGLHYQWHDAMVAGAESVEHAVDLPDIADQSRMLALE